MDLTEAKDIKKKWQEYTEELYKKDLHDPDNHNGMITHLEPDILECEVKWTLGSITMNKASGSDGIPVELFQIVKDDGVKVLHSICQQIWKTQQWPGLEKVSFHSNPKECSNHCTVALISHASKVMLKILQARLQQYWTMNFQVFKLDLEKAEEAEIKLPTSTGLFKKQESSRKTSTALLTMPKPLTVWITTNWKILKEMGIPDHLPASWEIYMQVRKQQLELDLEQRTGSKSGKEYIKAVYCHHAYLIYMQSKYIMRNTGLNEAEAGIKIARRNITNLR